MLLLCNKKCNLGGNIKFGSYEVISKRSANKNQSVMLNLYLNIILIIFRKIGHTDGVKWLNHGTKNNAMTINYRNKMQVAINMQPCHKLASMCIANSRYLLFQYPIHDLPQFKLTQSVMPQKALTVLKIWIFYNMHLNLCLSVFPLWKKYTKYPFSQICETYTWRHTLPINHSSSLFRGNLHGKLQSSYNWPTCNHDHAVIQTASHLI